MAKNSLFWGKASGKLGEVVMYRAGGEQRSRMYVQNVKNPKTLAQMEQRIKMASLVGFFKAAKQILKYSFPQRPVNQSGFNAFVAASLPNASTVVSREAANEGLSVPYGYTIAKGDILIPRGWFAAPKYAEGFTDVTAGIQLFPTGTLDTQNTVESAAPGMSAQNLAAAMDDALRLYPSLSESLPAKFNLCIVYSSYKDDGFSTEFVVIKFDRSTGTLTADNSFVAFEDGTIPVWKGTTALGSTMILCPQMEDNDNGASLVGAFLSYTDAGGKLHVSDATMMVNRDTDGYIEQFQKDGVAYVSYLEGLGYNAGNVLGTR